MFLVLYYPDGETFDVEAIQAALCACPHCVPLRLGRSQSRKYEYQYHGDTTTIEISDDGRSIVIDGMGPASFAAAVEIQSMSAQAARVVDDNYSFEFSLRDFQTGDDLYRAVLDAGA